MKTTFCDTVKNKNKVRRSCHGVSGLLLLVLISVSGAPTNSQTYKFGCPSTVKYGLTDLNGKELVPPIYAYIKYLGHGLFLLKPACPEPAKSDDRAREKLLLNNSFTKLKPSVPPGTIFERILWLGSRAEKEPDFVATELASDALLVFQKGSYSGVCDSKGKIIVPADCVWVGNFSEDIVAFRKSNGLLYTYNFASKTLQKLAYQNVRHDFRLTFREGLAIFATAKHEGKSLWGYLDPTGNIAIKPQYDYAENFNGGLACVRIPAGPVPSHNELIDKSGKFVSPSGLEVVASVGSNIIVKNQSGNFGVVNHKFDYVIQPKYSSICAENLTQPTVDESTPWEGRLTEPIGYSATRNEDGKLVNLSQKGDLISVETAESKFAGPRARSKEGPISVSRPPRQLAPGILLKRIPGSKENRERLGYQLAMSMVPKDRTLHEYICEPLKSHVEAFSAGRYQETLNKLRQAKFDERKIPIYQPVFIRGLCLQAMGNFEKASAEYATVIKSSNDTLLKEKSQMGLDSCTNKQSSIPKPMLTFPVRWSRGGGFDVPIQSPYLRREL